MSATVVDTYGISATTDAFVTIDDTKTVAQLITDVGAWALLTQELSQGKLDQYRITVIGTPVSPPAAAGDVEKGALFNFNNASDPYAQGYWIPDVKPSVLNASGLVDLSNTTVIDFVAFMTTAHTVITVVTKGVRALTTLKDALISFRKHRKSLERRTKEV
jgi:hypothetical protein